MKYVGYLILLIVFYIAFFKHDYVTGLMENDYDREFFVEQNEILDRLQKIDNENVRLFIYQWKGYAKKPTYEQLSELKEINENILRNPDVAEKYTIQWHTKNSLCGVAKQTFGSDPGCVPGL